MTSVRLGDVNPDPLRIAQACAGRNLRVVPGSLDGRRPIIKDWPRRATTDLETIVQWWAWEFPGADVCVVTGRESGVWVLDVDPRNGGEETLAELERAHGALPATFTVRTASGGRHLYFQYPDDREVVTRGNTLGPGLDTRGLGGQVMAPSTQGLYVPDDARAGWARAPDWLLDLVERREGDAGHAGSGDFTGVGADDIIERAADVEGGRQNEYLFRSLCALRNRGAGLEDLQPVARAVIERFVNTRPDEPWTYDEADATARRVCSVYETGRVEEWQQNLANQLSTQAPSSGGIDRAPPPTSPVEVAQHVVERRWRQDDWPTIRFYRDAWYTWTGWSWQECPEQHVRDGVYGTLFGTSYENKDGNLVPFNPDTPKVNKALDALRTIVGVSHEATWPSWLDGREEPPAGEVVALENGLLHLPTRELHPLTPAFFNHYSLPFPHDPGASCPTWERALADWFPGDPESVETIRDWFGYVLSGETRAQKALLAVGPRRSGKGTVTRVLETLLGGKRNITTPSSTALGEPFGRAELIGKPLAIVHDWRGGGRNPLAMTEFILNVTGEDTVEVERKYKSAWRGQLHTRLMFISNEVPKLPDASATIASRFIAVSFAVSFLGREDLELHDRLRGEMSGILNWALTGYDRLRARSWRLGQPRTGEHILDLMAGNSSQVVRFARDRCEFEPGAEVTKDDLYLTYQQWAKESGERPLSKNIFGRDMQSAYPQVREGRSSEPGRPRTYRGVRASDPRLEWARGLNDERG